MAQIARFTFDLDLEPRPASAAAPQPEALRPVPVPSIPEDVVAQLIANAREDAYAEGLAAGERNAAAMAAQTVAAAAGTLAMQSVQMAQALDEARGRHRSEAVELAVSVGRKLALHLMVRFPLTELQALVAECLTSLNGVPHLVIRCHPDLADAIRDTTTAQMTSSGFSGRLVVMGDPDIRLGDGRLEWVDGGLVRDIAAISREIDQQVVAYLASHTRRETKQEHGS